MGLLRTGWARVQILEIGHRSKPQEDYARFAFGSDVKYLSSALERMRNRLLKEGLLKIDLKRVASVGVEGGRSARQRGPQHLLSQGSFLHPT